MTTSLETMTDMEQQRRILLHLKCLVWCLHQMQTRYDLNLALYSLEQGTIHGEIRDSNLGDNLAFLIEHLRHDDHQRLKQALIKLPDSISSLDVGEKHFEIGHYLQATRAFNGVSEGSYGIISCISPKLTGLFLLDERPGYLQEVSFDPADVRVIFGTFII